MVTEEEWAEFDRKISSWEKWKLEKTEADAKRASQKVLDDAKVTPQQLRRPVTI